MRRDVFQAIADPTRREIIDLLAQEPLTINEIADRFQSSRPAISKHLKILSECGLVQYETQGRERRCVLIPNELSQLAAWVEPHRRLWEGQLDRFETYLNTLKDKHDGN